MTQPKELNLQKSGKPGNRLVDIVGKRFGRITVVSFAGFKETRSGSRQYFWLCRCECGTEKVIDGCCLRRRSTISCGCLIREKSTTHGMSETSLYGIWLGIKQRCRNPRSTSYRHYGGRGVDICDEWFDSFEAFGQAVGRRPSPLHTIDRIDNSRGYEPGNVRWATRAQQNENTRQTRLLAHEGEVMSIGKWARKTGLLRRTIRDRIDRLGWSVRRALSTPARPIRKRGAK